jgi:hypothetical protein
VSLSEAGVGDLDPDLAQVGVQVDSDVEGAVGVDDAVRGEFRDDKFNRVQDVFG